MEKTTINNRPTSVINFSYAKTLIENAKNGMIYSVSESITSLYPVSAKPPDASIAVQITRIQQNEPNSLSRNHLITFKSFFLRSTCNLIHRDASLGAVSLKLMFMPERRRPSCHRPWLYQDVGRFNAPMGNVATPSFEHRRPNGINHGTRP
ncbi:hypothetical protein TcasGA2_TC012728 [Tribolium castaneum]|uniref:Uncharacterized protein n=1 Tax=Tribolium castaneum TaxID=7070 RepID=D6WZV2_TRICA|nr:hypothetical protein TcasGA2_TC012728 [Tribolium castaneum]